MTRQRWHTLLLFLAFLTLSLAASPTTFCKCTCLSNSTIIPLDSRAFTNNSASKSSSALTCNDCTKQFCLSLDLAICASTPERTITDDDVFTKCFQRDSFKDEAIVVIFIVATVGLLAWAAVKPWVAKWNWRGRGRGGERGEYVPVGGGVEVR